MKSVKVDLRVILESCVVDLRKMAESEGLVTDGLRAELQARLIEKMQQPPNPIPKVREEMDVFFDCDDRNYTTTRILPNSDNVLLIFFAHRNVIKRS